MTIDDFKHELSVLNVDFAQLSPFNQDYQHIRFIGPFAEQDIVWDAHIYSLSYFVHSLNKPLPNCGNVRAFLDVGEENELGRKIEIGLHLPYLDVPSLKKTIIMVRQYKRLTLGRYEFGEIIDV
ncbi:hypothetical protein MNBD_GAMMA21-2853 [hydrothermal vent metagenome]|uniref:Uncharacterized protein n=1 Tax=hydrothermal vent metagenome TaxID=652676 RepID=A0A3B1AC08_9ZZZZ